MILSITTLSLLLSHFIYTASAQTFISAQDPRVLVSGRTQLNSDGVSRSFDWEGIVFYITVTGSGPVYLNVTSSAGNVNRVITDIRAGGQCVKYRGRTRHRGLHRMKCLQREQSFVLQ